LIVDDNPMIAKMVRVWLERTGFYKTREQTDPLHALETARHFKPDLVLLDVDMPGMDGGKVGDAIRRDPELGGTPILFLTAFIARAESLAGGRKFIPKPVSPAELIESVEEALAVCH